MVSPPVDKEELCMQDMRTVRKVRAGLSLATDPAVGLHLEDLGASSGRYYLFKHTHDPHIIFLTFEMHNNYIIIIIMIIYT